MTKNEENNRKVLFKGGLKKTLFFWFLIISLIPLCVVSFISYKNAYNCLFSKEVITLSLSAKLKDDLIESYFTGMITNMEF